jgi:threonine dehydratase
MTLPTMDDVEAAARRLGDQVLRTPLVRAAALEPLVGTALWLKLETQQRTGSFKERGALNKLLRLDRSAGVVTSSAGNHAQALACHAQRLGIPATIVMPAATPFVKVDRTAAFGARVVLHGADLSEAEQEANRLAAAEGLVMVHPYDDADVIAGQGTIGLEMLADRPDLDVLIVPIGGGGLVSGIALAARALKPSIEIVGVQVESYAAMLAAVEGSERPLGGSTLAEGIAVKRPGTLTRAVIAATVDAIVTVPEARIEEAVQQLAERQNLVAEGAGAAGVAALLAYPGRWAGRSVGTVLCGGNIDQRLIASILMRGLVRGGRLIRLRAELPDLPGQLARLADRIGGAGGNIVEITHQRLFLDVPAKAVEVDIAVEARGPAHAAEIVEQLRQAGIVVRVLEERERD